MSFYLYNGIKLPVLPSTAYQFAYIKKESAVYRLFLLDSEAVWIGLEMFGDGNANGLQYICSTDGTEWTVAEDTTSVIADSNYPCIWCNTDMVKGIADGTIYLAASAPIPVTAWKFNLQDLLSGMASAAASRGVLRRTPIAYLYNGVQLPGLPDVDGYAVIGYSTNWSKYIFAVSSFKREVMSTGSVAITGLYLLTEDGSAWEYNESTTSAKVIWANYDVMYATNDINTAQGIAGTLYLSASDPIPVYE